MATSKLDLREHILTYTGGSDTRFWADSVTWVSQDDVKVIDDGTAAPATIPLKGENIWATVTNADAAGNVSDHFKGYYAVLDVPTDKFAGFTELMERSTDPDGNTINCVPPGDFEGD